ncbi:MAG: carboxypeptidase regulatory-like domain-containing protein [Burkholderiales bacterium]|nr:carboxypeptidase regulatory-like domain-containing protein [Burkholderiales bacterium]
MSPHRIALLLATSLALAAPAAHAQDIRNANVEFTTGGVGLNARQEMLAHASPYNLHLEFAEASDGEYVSDVEVNIADARGANVLSTRTDGPWLLAKLPAGSYTVSARYGNALKRQQVTVGAGRRHLVVRFPAMDAAEQLAGYQQSSGR